MPRLKHALHRASIYYLPNLKREDRSIIFIGILGAFLIFIGLIFFTLLFGKPLGTDDAALHFNYAWDVYNHHLPEFFQRPKLPIQGLSLPPVQWTSQHPPLYYLMLAPFIGFPLSHHHPNMAVYAGGFISAVMAFTALMFIPFFINRWGVSNKNGLIAATLMSATIVRFIGVGGSVYNDSLAILLSVLSIGISGLVIINGPLRKYLLSLTLVVSLGMLTRAFLAINLATVCLVVFLSLLTKNKKEYGIYLAFLKSIWWPIIIFATAAIVSSWYYLRNHRLTGSFLGGSSEWTRDHLHRMPHGILDVLRGHKFYQLPFHLFNDNNTVLFPLICLFLLLGGIYYLFSRILPSKNSRYTYIGLMCIAYILLGWALQAIYASHGGSINTRYLLPALMPLVYVMTLGVLQFKKLGIIALGCISIAGAVTSANIIIGSYHDNYRLLSNGVLKLPLSSLEALIMIVVLLCLVVAGFVLVFLSLLPNSGLGRRFYSMIYKLK